MKDFVSNFFFFGLWKSFFEKNYFLYILFSDEMFFLETGNIISSVLAKISCMNICVIFFLFDSNALAEFLCSNINPLWVCLVCVYKPDL